MAPVHDLARFLRIGHCGLEAVQRRADEAANELGIGPKRLIGGDDAVAVVIKAGIGIRQAEYFLWGRGNRQQRLADRELSDTVDASGISACPAAHRCWR